MSRGVLGICILASVSVGTAAYATAAGASAVGIGVGWAFAAITIFAALDSLVLARAQESKP